MNRTTKDILVALGFIAVGAALIVAGVFTFPAGGAIVLLFFGACLFVPGLIVGIMSIMMRFFPPPRAGAGGPGGGPAPGPGGPGPAPDPLDVHSRHSVDNSQSNRRSTQASQLSRLSDSSSAHPEPGTATTHGQAPLKSTPATDQKEGSPPTSVIKRRNTIG